MCYFISFLKCLSAYYFDIVMLKCLFFFNIILNEKKMNMSGLRLVVMKS